MARTIYQDMVVVGYDAETCVLKLAAEDDVCVDGTVRRIAAVVYAPELIACEVPFGETASISVYLINIGDDRADELFEDIEVK